MLMKRSDASVLEMMPRFRSGFGLLLKKERGRQYHLKCRPGKRLAVRHRLAKLQDQLT
jgi:hypothetical protein